MYHEQLIVRKQRMEQALLEAQEKKVEYERA